MRSAFGFSRGVGDGFGSRSTRGGYRRIRMGAYAVIAVFLLAWISAYSARSSEPVYQGQRIGFWFDELCLGGIRTKSVDVSRIERMSAAADVLSKAGPDAIPFLIGKLNAKGSPVVEHLVLKGETLPVVGGVFQRIVPPSHKRMYAAFALRRMGRAVEPSVPILLEAFANERDLKMKSEILSVVATSIGMQAYEAYRPRGRENYEKAVLQRLRERMPESVSAHRAAAFESGMDWTGRGER